MSIQQPHQKEAGRVSAEQFREFHDQYRGRLVNSMISVVRDRETAEDATAAALAIAWEKLNRFRGEASLYTWVYRIASNEARRQRSQKRPLSLDALEAPPKELTESDGASGDAQERADRRLKLRKALMALPPKYQALLTDHFVRGYRVRQIARRRKIPLGTALSRIDAAKRSLRAAWERTT